LFELEGFYVSLISPFNADYSLDIDGFRDHLRRVMDSDLPGVVVAGTNGEFSSLSNVERKTLYKTAVDGSKEGKKVICNVGCVSTWKTLDLAVYCKDVGADCLMIAPPYMRFSDEEGIFQHYKTISDQVSLPVILFNVPFYGHTNLHPALVQRLTELENVVGIKEAELSVYQMMDQIRLNGDKISILSGAGANVLPAMSVGAKGIITTWPEFVPKMAVRFFNLIKGGDLKGALEIHRMILPLARSVGDAHRIKAGFNLMGLPAGPPRPPLLPATDEEKEEIRKALLNLQALTD
jgi:4-hydroxy-tetrahydrodipicolinate synthase